MRQQLIGIIDTTPEFNHEAAGTICAPLLPFAGNFRLIDFMLSNFANAYIRHVFLSLPDRCHSLVSYIGGGEVWHYGTNHAGIKYLPSLSSAGKEDWEQALTSSTLKNAIVVLTKGTTVCNIKLESLYKTHIDNNKDITILTYENERIGTYLLSLELLLQLLQKSSESESWSSLIEKHEHNLSKGFIEINGYGIDINSIEKFYKANMEILWPERMKSLLFQANPILRRYHDHHPTVYGSNSRVTNSLVGKGCMIEGRIENSIIFPNCRIEKDVTIRNCVVMEDSIIPKGQFEQMIYNPAYTINNMLAFKEMNV